MNTQPDPRGEQLTEATALRRFILQTVWTLCWTSGSLSALVRRDMTEAALLSLVGVSQAWFLPALWKQYRFIRNGGLVYTALQPEAKPLAGGTLVFLIVVLLVLTALVGGTSFVTAVLLAHVRRWEIWLIAGAVNVGLWLYVIHCWRRILFPKPQPTQTVEYGEPQENVWPPPPQRPI